MEVLKLTDTEFKRARQQNHEICQSAQQLLEYGAEREGYWMEDCFMTQVINAAVLLISNITKINTQWFGCLIRAVATKSSMSRHLHIAVLLLAHSLCGSTRIQKISGNETVMTHSSIFPK